MEDEVGDRGGGGVAPLARRPRRPVEAPRRRRRRRAPWPTGRAVGKPQGNVGRHGLQQDQKSRSAAPPCTARKPRAAAVPGQQPAASRHRAPWPGGACSCCAFDAHDRLDTSATRGQPSATDDASDATTAPRAGQRQRHPEATKSRTAKQRHEQNITNLPHLPSQPGPPARPATSRAARRRAASERRRGETQRGSRAVQVPREQLAPRHQHDQDTSRPACRAPSRRAPAASWNCSGRRGGDPQRHGGSAPLRVEVRAHRRHVRYSGVG